MHARPLAGTTSAGANKVVDPGGGGGGSGEDLSGKGAGILS